MTMERNKVKIIAETFRNSLDFPQILSKSGSELLFESDALTGLFRERFGIAAENKASFDAAFHAVTEGNGKEINKINSVASSALLQLLFFYKLYIPKEGQHISITLEGKTIEFNQAFFEVRNNVIRDPSCVDVALVASDGKTILFIESKLKEMFEDSKHEKSYGISYQPLYSGTAIEGALNKGGIEVAANATNLILRSEKEPQYLEGVKQTISHLIGLVRGPQDTDDQKDYIEAYKRANRLIYSPILFDTSAIFNDNTDESSKFASLYAKVIGSNSGSILEAIKKWDEDLGHKRERTDKHIEIRPYVLTYQNVVKENPIWLDERVKTFYGL